MAVQEIRRGTKRREPMGGVQKIQGKKRNNAKGETEHRRIGKNTRSKAGTKKRMKCKKNGREKEQRRKNTKREQDKKENWLTKQRLPRGEVAGSELQFL